MMKELLERLKEKSTWIVLLGLVTTVLGLNAEQVDAISEHGPMIANGGLAMMTLVGVFTKERKKGE